MLTQTILPDSFKPEAHWYQKSHNAQLHPVVSFFMNLSNERIATRYSHLNPRVDRERLLELLLYKPKYFKWAGSDLLRTVTEDGKKKMIVIETNSCPSGQKSFPLLNENEEMGGYRSLIESTFLPMLKKKHCEGGLAVLYDKNEMETSGYAAVIAELTGEKVYLVPCFDEQNDQVRFRDQVLEVLDEAGVWQPIRAAFRYVTQRPWNRIPLFTKTKFLNPVICCLAGGRNKLIAAKAYNLFNAELTGSGLSIVTPQTIWDVRKNEIPLWVRKFGNRAVVKVPYSNAGQGVYTIVNEQELEDFMNTEFRYEKFVVQSLVGNYYWSSQNEGERLFHTGTIPSVKQQSYVFDLRMMVSSSKQGFRPLAIYSRRAAEPLTKHIEKGIDSKSMLITNLSIKKPDGSWGSDESRLLLMDRKDFNRLGVSLDDLIEGYIQTVMAIISIDTMAQNLISSQKTFKRKLFSSLNDDQVLLDEILC